MGLLPPTLPEYVCLSLAMGQYVIKNNEMGQLWLMLY